MHRNGGRGIRFHRAASQEDRDAIQAFGALRTLQSARTTLASDDYKARRVLGASLAADPRGGGAHAPALEDYDWVGAYAFADQEQAERAVRLRREAIEARNETWIGQASVRSFRPGTCFDLTESPLEAGADSGAQESKRRFLLLEVRSCGIKNYAYEPFSESASGL